MNCFEYQKELEDLMFDQEKITFFCELCQKKIRSEQKTTKDVLETVLAFTENNKLDIASAWMYYYLGWYYNDIGKFHTAVEIFLIANNIFEANNIKKGVIYACNGLTFSYSQIGQFSLSGEWGLKGISLSEDESENGILTSLLINTAISYVEMKCYDKASEILSHIKMLDYTLSNEQEITCKINLAEIELNIGDSNKALVYVDEIKELQNQMNLSIYDVGVYLLEGIVYTSIKQYEKAFEDFEKAFELSKENSYIYEQCNIVFEWAKLEVILDHKERAVNMLIGIIKDVEKGKFYMLLSEIYYLLHSIYKKMNKLKKSIEYLEKHLILEKSIYNYNSNQTVTKIKAKHTEKEAALYKLLYDKTELASQIGQQMISNFDANVIIDILNKEINKLIKTDIFGIALYDEEKLELNYHFSYSNINDINNVKFGSQKMDSLKSDDASAFSIYCIKNKTDIMIGDVDKEYVKYVNSVKVIEAEGQSIKSIIYVPIMINDRIIGVMTTQNYKAYAYDKNDLNTLKILSNYAAIAFENASAYKRIEKIATYDNMTGFLTKSEILKIGNIIFEKYKETEASFSVVMIDIDNFKNINDTYGHISGDKAIKMIAQTISKNIRATDYIGRYGGDEFLLICPKTTRKETLIVAERIRKTVCDNPFAADKNNKVNLTLSLGISDVKESDSSFMTVVNHADKFLYSAKNSSKNTVSHEE